MKYNGSSLLKSIKTFFVPPKFEDADKNLRAGILYLILLIDALAVVIYLVFMLVTIPFNEIAKQVVFLGSAILITVVALHFVKKGYVQAISFFLVFFTWSLLTIGSITAGGTQAPAFYNYFIPIFIAGIFFGRKGVMLALLGVVATFIGVYFIETQNLVKIAWVQHTSFTRLILASTFVIISGILVYIAIARIEQTLNDIRVEIQHRKQSEEKVLRLNLELEETYTTTLEGWALALELKDKETEGHSRRVTALSLKIAGRLGYSEEQLTNMERGALLHDIGKMGIADEILWKEEKLSVYDWAEIKKHPQYAHNMLKSIDYLHDALVIPCFHHEQWDGNGYPDGIAGEEIPEMARIFALVDNWDALTTDRPYRKAWSEEKVIAYIKSEAGKKFDPRLVPLFLEIVTGEDQVNN